MTTAEVDVLAAVARTLAAISAHPVRTQTSLDLSQIRALVIVASLGSPSLGELADGARMHLSTASRLCDRLVGMGLLHRAEDPTNRRQVALTLTASGKQAVQQIRQQRRQLLRTLLETVPESMRTQLVALLQEVVVAGGEPVQADLWATGWTT